MKVRNLTKSVLVALMISSPMVGAETQYPAADFQPEIIKQDQELIAKTSSTPSSAASSSSSSSSSSSNNSSKSEPKYTSSAPAVAAPAEDSSNLTYLWVVLALLRRPSS